MFFVFVLVAVLFVYQARLTSIDFGYISYILEDKKPKPMPATLKLKLSVNLSVWSRRAFYLQIKKALSDAE